MNLTNSGRNKFKQKDKITFKREFSSNLGGYAWSSDNFDGEYLSKRYALESVAMINLDLFQEELKWISDSILEQCLSDKGCVVVFEEMLWGR